MGRFYAWTHLFDEKFYLALLTMCGINKRGLKDFYEMSENVYKYH